MGFYAVFLVNALLFLRLFTTTLRCVYDKAVSARNTGKRYANNYIGMENTVLHNGTFMYVAE